MDGMTRRQLLQLGGAALTTAGMSSAMAGLAPGRLLRIEARPASVEVVTSRAAVVVVDMQNDFGAKGGMFDRAGLDISGIRNVVAPTARTLELARRAGMHIAYLKMAYRADLADLGPAGSFNRSMHEAIGVGAAVTAPDGRASRVLVRDTWNTEILPELAPAPGDLVIRKTRFSGFYETDLHQQLQARGVRDLLFTGCTTSVCVESTVRDAAFRDYKCVLFSDCMFEPLGHGQARSNHEATLDVIAGRFGWVADSGAFERALAV